MYTPFRRQNNALNKQSNLKSLNAISHFKEGGQNYLALEILVVEFSGHDLDERQKGRIKTTFRLHILFSRILN